MLLTREEFRKRVFERDEHICVVPDCDSLAVDAHHIIERRLWDDGGYYLENGASLCEIHHKMAEVNQICPQILREWCGISETKQPSSFKIDEDYDKWGNILAKPNRDRPKYPTTNYLPFSPIPENHNRDIGETKYLLNVPLIFTEKMDGSNVKLTHELVASRNGTHADHPSFDMLKARHSKIKDKIPEYLDIFGEWLYAEHSILYKGLEDYLQIFAIYNTNTNMWLSWNEVERYAKLLRCLTVPILEKSVIEKDWQLAKKVTDLARKVIDGGGEGIVVRNSFPFHYGLFQYNVMKFVRENHVQTDTHWRHKPIVRNQLCEASMMIT